MPTNSSTTDRIDSRRVILWASAFIIAALVIMQAGRLTVNPAYASSEMTGGNYTILTADSGRGEDFDPDDILVVIDNAAEVLMVFEVDVRARQITPLDGGSLPVLFRNALNR